MDPITELKGWLVSLFALMAFLQSCQEPVQTEPVDLTEESRYTKMVLTYGLNEPTEFVVLRDSRIIFTERKGDIKIFDPESGNLNLIGTIPVYTDQEDGLLGIGLDPNFHYNKWVYLYYSPEGDEPVIRLSRFTIKADQLDISSEKVMLEVPTQRKECCHTAGSIEFGPDGLLYLSTGDDTNPHTLDGYAPIDERQERKYWNAQRTSGNTNDLRGKILRIKPESDGTYSIPEGNLFPPGTPYTRPEIYVMGCRNPYRISIDQKRNWLFWGDVGPDANTESPLKGPRGYDEINLATTAGFFGWPYFIGNNQAYRKYDHQRGASGPEYNPQTPQNASLFNSGIKDLPPAQAAFIWYPYASSADFPDLGTGGRTAMAGPVFYREDYEENRGTFPSYFDGRFFFYEWIRGWIFTAGISEDASLLDMQPFMPQSEFNSIIDMEFGPDGRMYLLEYGTGWFSKNDDAAISVIDFNPGNRKPVLKVAADQLRGSAPLTVNFTTEGSMDYDGDELRFRWEIDGQKFEGAALTYDFVRPGVYYPRVTVFDSKQNRSTQQLVISVGNDAPKLRVETSGNRTFYWPGTEIDYHVSLTDLEDGELYKEIDPSQVQFKIDRVEGSLDMTESNQMGHQTISKGLRLIEAGDCMACHKMDQESVGPSYVQVAHRYQNNEEALEFLSRKVISGGGGNWGEHAMSAHPDLKVEDSREIIEYILSLGVEEETELSPLEGKFVFNTDEDESVYFVFTATYTDKGAMGMPPISEKEQLLLRDSKVPAGSFSQSSKVKVNESGNKKEVENILHGTYLRFDNIDFNGLSSVEVISRTIKGRMGGKLELHIDAIDGPIIGHIVDRSSSHTINLDQDGIHDLYLVFANDSDQKNRLHPLEWLIFD